MTGLGLAWQPLPNIQALTTFRHAGGASAAPYDSFNFGLNSGDQPETVLANRDELHRRLALPSAPRWLRQVHGTHVVREPDEDRPEADASTSRTPGTVLAILTADCLPVLFAADDASEVGAAHAGWPGLSAGVLEATLDSLHTPASRLLAWMGPCAGPRRYEIGENVYAAFVDPDPAAAAFFTPTRPGHWLADLPGIARHRLARAGVQRVYGGTECTISDPARWYSYRRDGATGRMATLIWISPAGG